mgnify:CR=1 FL=1
MSAPLHNLAPRINAIFTSHGGTDAAVEPAGWDGINAVTERKRKDVDPALLDLRVMNLSRAIADGDISGSIQLGILFADFITGRLT